ncbi:hypothetical protein E4U12_002210 [Claviceps purpurea]|nr:hypothetical protein E4U12_002210 [Claviceps purpurea]
MPCVNIDFILEAQQIWADKFARGRCYRHYETEGSSIQKLYKTKVHARDRYMQHVRQHQKKTWKFDARACFEADYERALQFPPWEKKRRLFWFVRAGVFQPSNGFINGKVRLASLDAAMISPEKPDPLVIKCLMPTLLLRTVLQPKAVHNRLVKLCSRVRRGGDTQDMRKFLRYFIREMHKNQENAVRRHPYDSSEFVFTFRSDHKFYEERYNELVDEVDEDWGKVGSVTLVSKG